MLPLALVVGCTTTRRITNTPATALQQLLDTEAIDRAVHKLTWPDVAGRTVFVQTASPAEEGDRTYLRQAISAELAQRGAILSEDYTKMDYMVTVLAGAIGTDERDVFFGLPQIQSMVVPLSLPEMAIYKSEEQEGFAKVEVVTTDVRRGAVVFRAGPAQAKTYAHTRKVLFVGWYRTDTTRDK